MLLQPFYPTWLTFLPSDNHDRANSSTCTCCRACCIDGRLYLRKCSLLFCKWQCNSHQQQKPCNPWLQWCHASILEKVSTTLGFTHARIQNQRDSETQILCPIHHDLAKRLLILWFAAFDPENEACDPPVAVIKILLWLNNGNIIKVQNIH